MGKYNLLCWRNILQLLLTLKEKYMFATDNVSVFVQDWQNTQFSICACATRRQPIRLLSRWISNVALRCRSLSRIGGEEEAKGEIGQEEFLGLQMAKLEWRKNVQPLVPFTFGVCCMVSFSLHAGKEKCCMWLVKKVEICFPKIGFMSSKRSNLIAWVPPNLGLIYFWGSLGFTGPKRSNLNATGLHTHGFHSLCSKVPKIRTPLTLWPRRANFPNVQWFLSCSPGTLSSSRRLVCSRRLFVPLSQRTNNREQCSGFQNHKGIITDVKFRYIDED